MLYFDIIPKKIGEKIVKRSLKFSMLVLIGLSGVFAGCGESSTSEESNTDTSFTNDSGTFVLSYDSNESGFTMKTEVKELTKDHVVVQSIQKQSNTSKIIVRNYGEQIGSITTVCLKDEMTGSSVQYKCDTNIIYPLVGRTQSNQETIVLYDNAEYKLLFESKNRYSTSKEEVYFGTIEN